MNAYNKTVHALVGARERLGLSQIDMAKGVGSTQANISRFENGQMRPNIIFMNRVAKALGYVLDIKLRTQHSPHTASPCRQS